MRPNEVVLNSVRYPVIDKVRPVLMSNPAEKQVIGDYTLDSDPNHSYWGISDQTGGILVEEFLRADQANRSYFSNCNADYAGHLFLPKLATAVALPSDISIVNATMEADSSWTAETGTSAQSSAQARSGTYSWIVTAGASNALTYQDISVTAALIQGATIIVSGYGYSHSATPEVSIGIDDGVTTTYSNTSTAASWTLLTVTKKMSASATRFRIYLRVVGALDTAGYFDDLTTPVFDITTPGPMCEFNSQIYAASGKCLYRLNATGDGWIYKFNSPATITSLTPTVNSTLLIGQGNSNVYYYMDTSEVFTATNVSAMYYAVHWDNKSGKIPTTGQFSYTATPNSATPTWTNNGLVDPASVGTPAGLITFSDSSGNDIIYCPTTRGLLAHDYTNALWLNTELKLPTHADNGKGITVQDGKLYYSAGTSVFEYMLGGGDLAIRSMGLDSDDGLPDEYVGSIVKFVGGFGGEFYALVDASLISASNKSFVVKWDGSGWHPMWLDGTANETMYDGLVSSVYAYRLWWGVGSTYYWIPLDRAHRNPLKTTSTYASAGVHYSPRFDAGWRTGNKLATSIKVLGQSLTSTETIVIKYRTNVLPTTALATGWTTAATLAAADNNVEKTISLGSGVGVAFKNIQFEIDLARGADSSKTPDLRYLTLEYDKLLPSKWGWRFTVDCSKGYNDRGPTQLLDDLITAAETQAMVTFSYAQGTTKYVRVLSVEGERETGETKKGLYSVLVVEK